MNSQWDPRTWRKVRFGLILIHFMITVQLKALEAWILKRWWQKRTTTETTDSTGSENTATQEVSLPGVPGIPEACPPPTPTPLSSEQRRTLDWVRLGSHDDSSYTFHYAQDHHRLEATVPVRPQSEGSEPIHPEAEDVVKNGSLLPTPESSEGGVEILPQAGSPMEDNTTQEAADTDADQTPDEGVQSEEEGDEVVRPDSVERPATSLGFRPEDDQHEDDDDREVATTSPTIDTTKEYELPQSNSDLTSEEEAVQDGAPEAEVAVKEIVKENVGVIPVIERTTEKPPRRQQRPDTLFRDKRNELMELRSKLKLLQVLRGREEREFQLDVDPSSTTTAAAAAPPPSPPPQQEQDAIDGNEVAELSDERRAELMELRSKLQLLEELREREKQESQQDIASSSTTIAASPYREQEAAGSDELSGLSEEKRAELMELREKLMLLVEVRELEEAPGLAPAESSIPVSTAQEKEMEEVVEEDEISSDANQEFHKSQSHEPANSEPATVDNDDEILPPSPPPEEPLEEEEYHNGGDDDGLINPLSSDADEAMNFVKAWLLLPADLSALEVLYQVANLRDTLTFIPGWVPTKHSLVRNDESLLVRSQPVPYEINWHFLVRLRSVRWRELLRAGAAVVDAADRAWLEEFLDEMEAPPFAFGDPREHHRHRRSRSRNRSKSPRPGTPAPGAGRGGLSRQRSALHQVEAAAPPLPHEEEAVRAMNETLWTRHGLEAAAATVQAIYDNTVERVAWIDDRTVQVLTELEEMEQVLLRLLNDLTSLDADVGATIEVHGQDYAQMAGRIQQSLP